MAGCYTKNISLQYAYRRTIRLGSRFNDCRNVVYIHSGGNFVSNIHILLVPFWKQNGVQILSYSILYAVANFEYDGIKSTKQNKK